MRNPIDDAIAALRRGDQARAFALLRACLTRDPKDATAWLWMSEATPDIHRKIEALERFIHLAPDHPRVPSATARLHYLEAQITKLPQDPRPTVPIRYEEEAPPLEETPPPAAPDIEIEPTTPPPATEPKLSLLRRIEQAETSPAEASGQGGTPPPTPSTSPPLSDMSVQTAPRPAYQPAMPQLLQSLLDTAPMPRVRNDLPHEPSPALETAPRRAIHPDEHSVTQTDVPVVMETENDIVTTETLEGVQEIPQSRVTPWWAWALLTIMTVQVFMLVYIILRIEIVLAAMGR